VDSLESTAGGSWPWDGWLLAAAVEADAALAAQVEAYRCGNFSDSIGHSDRLHAIVAESAHLDRDLILTLRKAEEAAHRTLAALGIARVVDSP
jgi:hypothetical protein